MDSHLSPKNSKNMWMTVPPNLRSRGQGLGVGVRVGMAHTCYPNPCEVEAGNESGMHSEFQASLNY